LTLALLARIRESLGRIASGTLCAPERQRKEELYMAKKAKKAEKKAPKKGVK
jgi:hypothetical protein